MAQIFKENFYRHPKSELNFLLLKKNIFLVALEQLGDSLEEIQGPLMTATCYLGFSLLCGGVLAYWVKSIRSKIDLIGIVPNPRRHAIYLYNRRQAEVQCYMQVRHPNMPIDLNIVPI